ncbi:Protein disulfide-isomerase 5-3 [Capsicum chinense]|nr:Protein disulfide-isomerase 5-3 [Capsicum chinense]
MSKQWTFGKHRKGWRANLPHTPTEKKEKRDYHGHHDHESYYGDRDTDNLVKMMKYLIAPIKLEYQMNTSDNSSTKLATSLKRPAPVTGGCRIEGFVPGNLVISARSEAHSFDTSQMNMSHVTSSFSFGETITPKVTRDIKLVRNVSETFPI